MPTTLENQKISEDNMELPQNSTRVDKQDEDVAAIQVQIDWKEELPVPVKWETNLTKALQTLLSKTFQNCSLYPSLQKLSFLDTPLSAKIVISPSSACEVLLEKKFLTLKFKDNSETIVHFKTKVPVEDTYVVVVQEKIQDRAMQKPQEIPMTVNMEVSAAKYGEQVANYLLRKFAQYKTGPHTLTVKGSFEEVEVFYKDFCQSVKHPVASNNFMSQHAIADQMARSREPMRVPLYQYWYFNNMHSKELDRIQKRHRVTLKADVCVSVEETKDSFNDSFTNASNEFAELFKQHTEDLESIPVSSAPKLFELLQSFGTQLMLNASAQNWSLIGPRTHVYVAKRELNDDLMDDAKISDREHRDTTHYDNPHGESRWGPPRGIEIDIKDPVLTNGLRIHHMHWELLQKAFQKQYKDLKNKFGVDFKENTLHEDVMVTTHSVGNQVAYLELNALRALMSLHQKVVMTTMGCPLQNASNTEIEKVKMYLTDIRNQNPSFVVADGSANGGAWMIVGLPDHLRFAISEIEKRASRPVFDEKRKRMLGYERGSVFLRPFTDGPAWNGSKGYEGAAWEKGAASGGAMYKGMRVQGKTDRPLEREAEEKGAYVSSVDRETNYLDEGDGQKPRGARSKGTNGFEKEAGGADGGGTKEDDTCPICMDEFTNQKKLACGHGFCEDCLGRSIESLGASCPVCKKVFGKVEGDQPSGTMNDYIQRLSLPGFKHCDTIVINYNIPGGVQSSKHPKPGQRFHGTQRTAYLPDNKEGREVLALLKQAFKQKLIFTVGTSRTSGMDDCVTWNDIHHKTNTHGGSQNFGYPDDGYLKRVREELKAKGIE